MGIFIKGVIDRPSQRTDIRVKELKMHQDQIEFLSNQLTKSQADCVECDIKRREAELKAQEAETRLRKSELEHQQMVMQLKEQMSKIQRQLDQVQTELNVLKVRYPE